MRGSLLVLGVLGGTASAAVPQLVWNPVEAPFRGRDLCYPSGLRVSILQDPRSDVVSVTTVIEAGAVTDRPGTAHLVEHLWFRATPGGRSVHRQLREAGGTWNAFTLLDTTIFATQGPASALDQLVTLEADRLIDPLVGVDANRFSAERAVVANEHRMHSVEHPLERMSWLAADLFPRGHPYHGYRDPEAEEVEQMGLSDVRTFAHDHYRPDLTTILVVGAVDVAQVNRALGASLPEALLWEAAPDGTVYKSCDQREKPLPSSPQPTRAGGLRTMVQPAATGPILHFGWLLPPAWTGSDVDLTSATAWLESFLASAIAPSGAELLEKRPDCDVFPGAQASAAVCSVHLANASSADRVRRTTLTALKGFRALDHDSWALDLELARLDGLGGLLAEMDEVSPLQSSLASGYALFNHFRLSPEYFGQLIEQMGQQDGSQLEAFGRQWFRPELAHTVLVVPDTRPRPAAVAAPVVAVETSVAIPPRPGTSESPDHLGLADEAVRRRLSAMHQLTLDNGLRVVILPWGDAPLVRASLVLGGGTGGEPAQGVAALASELRWYETRTRVPKLPYADLSTGLVVIGGEWTQMLGPEWRSENLSASSGNLSDLVYLVRHLVDKTRLDVTATGRDDTESWLSRWLDIRGDDAWSVPWWGTRAWLRQLFGPFHPAALATPEQAWWGLRSFDFGAIRAWHHAQLRPTNATLYLVGKLDPTEAEDLVAKHLGTWKAKERELPVAPPPVMPIPERRSFSIIDDPLREMAHVNVGCRVEPTADRAKIALAQQVLYDLAWTGLREGDGIWAYDADGTVVREQAGESAAMVTASVPSDRAGHAVRAGLAALQRVADGVPGADIDRARIATARAEVTGWHSTEQVVFQLMTWGGARADLDELGSYVATLRTVDSSALAQMFRSCPGHEAVVVTGPAKAAGAALIEQGYPVAVQPMEDEYRALRNRRAG